MILDETAAITAHVNDRQRAATIAVATVINKYETKQKRPMQV
ncbi:hypothetical protein [Haloquadratum walsbyi]|nr:hypothetical protein [Haloquadratum walsbyi]